MIKYERIGWIIFAILLFIVAGIVVAALSLGMSFAEVVELLWGLV